MVLVGFKPDLDDQLVSFSALTLLVWSPCMAYKIIPEMTCRPNVLSGTLNLYTTASCVCWFRTWFGIRHVTTFWRTTTGESQATTDSAFSLRINESAICTWIVWKHVTPALTPVNCGEPTAAWQPYNLSLLVHSPKRKRLIPGASNKLGDWVSECSGGPGLWRTGSEVRGDTVI